MKNNSWKEITIFLLLFTTGIVAQSDSLQIEKAMLHYDHLILTMNTDSISQMYTVDGELGDAAKGRDSIKSFLDKFKAFKVKLQKSTSQIITIEGDSAIQKGKYYQITTVPNRGNIESKGFFIAKWIRNKSSVWLLKRMETKPN